MPPASVKSWSRDFSPSALGTDDERASDVHAEGDAEDGGLEILRREGGTGVARRTRTGWAVSRQTCYPMSAWREKISVSSIRLRNVWLKSLWSSCPRCRLKRPKPYGQKSGAWRLSLPAAKVAEKLHGLGETRVLVVYPELPQNPHKLPLVVTPQDLFQLTQERGLFFERESVFLSHTRANSNRLLRPLLAIDVYTQLAIQEAT